ncbi:Uracil DNA glycosylase superfamily protein [compost metagenome]
MPMGLCYPGKGKSGDLPPRPECAPTWHDKVLMLLPNIELTLLIGQYAQHYYLRDAGKDSLTETVRNWADYGPAWLPLPHPSPRNTFWLKKNPWFEQEVIPHLQQRVAPLLL